MKWTGMSKMIKKKPKQAPSPALDDEEFGSFRKEAPRPPTRRLNACGLKSFG